MRIISSLPRVKTTFVILPSFHICLGIQLWSNHRNLYGELMVSRIQSAFDVNLSYIRGRSMPVGAQAILQEATPITAHLRLSGNKQTTGLPANSSSCND